MAQQINLLTPAWQPGARSQPRGLWLLPPLLLGLILPLGLWHRQQRQLEQALQTRDQLEQQLQAQRAEQQKLRLAAPSASERETRRQREQVLATLQARAAALGRQQGLSAPFQLLSGLTSEGVWLTAIEIGRGGISVTGQAIDATRAMKHVELLRLRLGAAGYRLQGYEIGAPGAAGGLPGATSFRVY